MSNLVGSGVVDKLIQNQYLHSNTGNFVDVINQHLASVKKEQVNNELLIKIKDRLENLLIETNKQMNWFYSDLSKYYESIGQNQKIIGGRDWYDKKNGEYHPDGANEFSRKFLINKTLSDNATDEQIILSIINSIESRSEIIRIYGIVSTKFANTSVKFNKEQQALIGQLNNIFNNEIFPTTNSMLYNEIGKAINSMFEDTITKAGRTKIKLTNKIQESKINDFNKLLAQLRIKNFSANRNDSLRELQNKLVNRLKDRTIFYEVGMRYWEYLNQKFKSETGRALHGAKQRKFARFFSEIIAGYSVNLIDAGQINSLNGFLLEFGTYASVNLPLSYTDEIVRVLGQENVTREYITEQYNLNGQKIRGTKFTTGQSPSDVEYVGKSGQVYRFQLKNSFEDAKNLSFRVQAEIKVSTYLATAFNGIDQDVKDILAYLLINTAFLRKYGLGAYNSEDIARFKPTDFPICRDYILFFLQQSYQFLIGYQYEKNVNKIERITAGNLAYIFQGRYLIPVAAYFYSALEMLKKILDNTNTYKPQGIGGIAGLPSFKNSSLPIKNTEFQENKINLLKKLKYNDAVYGEYKYPQGLLEYGSSYGRQLYNDLIFNRISINLTIGQLEKYFKK